MAFATIGGVNYDQYQTWQKVTAPSGQTYYKVPGSGFLFDPFVSNVKGRIVLWSDPKVQVDEKAKAEKEKQDLLKLQKQAASPIGQLTPILGSAGALVGAKYVGNMLNGAPEAAEAAAPIVNGVDTAVGAAAPVADAAGAFTGGVTGIGPVASGADYAAALGQAPGWSLNGIGAAGNYILPAAGALGAIDVLGNKRHGASGAFEGAASGAALGSFFGPPGAIAGAGIGGLVGYFGNFGDVDAYKTEWKRKKALLDKGLITADQLGPEPKAGRSKEDLVAEAQANGGNVTFAQSRNEADLTPQDIQGYATILEKAASSGLNPADISAKALEAGAVREHHGTIDVDWSKVNLTPPPPPIAATPSIDPGRIASNNQNKIVGQKLAARMNRRR